MEMSLASKIFLTSAVAWVTGRLTHLKIKGTPEEIQVIKAALLASQELYIAVNSEEETVESIITKLNRKIACGHDFEAITGIQWPL